MDTTLKSLFLVAALLALGTGIGVTAASPASAGLDSINGSSLNGLTINGIHMNGLASNGTAVTTKVADPNRLRLRAVRLPGE
jgi:hypothetical protein